MRTLTSICLLLVFVVLAQSQSPAVVVDISGCNQNVAINNGIGQSFTAPYTSTVNKLSIWIKPELYYVTSYYVVIREGNGPGGNSLGQSGTLTLNSLTSGVPSTWQDFTFSSQISLSAGSQYTWQLIRTSTYSGAFSECGNIYGGGNGWWLTTSADYSYDYSFQLYLTALGHPCDTNDCVASATCVDVDLTSYQCNCPQTPYPSTGDGRSSGTGCTWVCPVPQANATTLPPTLVSSGSGFLATDVLSIQWTWPTVATRTQPTVTFQNADGTTASGCTVPAFTTTSNGPCSQLETLQLQWTAATSQCGFHLAGQSGSGDTVKDIWSGSFILTATESVSTDRDTPITRTLSNQFVVQVSFDKYATVSTNVNVFAAVVVDTAITSQQFGTDVAGAGSIQFVTEVGYPFQLQLLHAGDPIDTAPSSILSTSLQSVDSTPATVKGDVSTQNWKFIVTPAAGTCVLDGLYSTSANRFQIVCTPAAITNNECPTLLNPNASMSFQVTSSNFCGQLVADVGVVLQMFSYGTNSLDTASQTNQFVIQPNGNAYFGISVQSSPKVTVSSLSVSRVTLSSNGLGVPRVLYNDGLTTDGTTFGYQAIAGTTTVGFGFSLTSSFNIPRDGSDVVSVTALVKLSYQGNGSKKREAYALLQATSDTSSRVQSSLQITSTSSSSIVQATALVFVPIFFFGYLLNFLA